MIKSDENVDKIVAGEGVDTNVDRASDRPQQSEQFSEGRFLFVVGKMAFKSRTAIVVHVKGLAGNHFIREKQHASVRILVSG